MTDSPRGSVFIAAPLGIGKKLIAPLVPSFKEKYADVNVRLRLSDRRIDITKEGLDAAFVLGELHNSEMRVRPLYEFELSITFEVGDVLKAGKLVEVLKETPPTSIPFSCIFPHKRLQDPKTKLLIEHMVDGCRERLG